MNDIEMILRFALSNLKRPINPNRLSVSLKHVDQFVMTLHLSRELQNYSALLIIPDHCDKGYIEGMIHILIDRMGFKQVAMQQVSAGELGY